MLATDQMLQLPHALNARGLDVFVVDGWASRGTRRMAERVSGVMAHWIVSTLRGRKDVNQTLGLITHGHSRLPGPLANLYLRWDGAVGVVAAGSANHGGVGSHRGVSQNHNWIGVEAEGPPFTPEQLEAYPKIFAACYDVTGRHPRDWAIGHDEYATPRGRKVDVSAYIHAIRADAVRLVDGRVFRAEAVEPSWEDSMKIIRNHDSGVCYLVGPTGWQQIMTEDHLASLVKVYGPFTDLPGQRANHVLNAAAAGGRALAEQVAKVLS